MRTVGRQTPQLCARKVGPNEARSLSLTFGKPELNLGITQSRSTRRIEPKPRATATTMTGRSSVRRHDRRALRVRRLEPAAKDQPADTDRSYPRALCDTDVN